MNASSPYFNFIRRWYWLIALSIVIAVVATHLALGDREPVYQSTATVQVGRTLQSKSIDEDALAIAERLIPAYGELASREQVLVNVIDSLDLDMTPDDIRARLQVIAVPRTYMIDIMVIDQNPEVAAAIANEIARELALQAPRATLDSGSQEFIQEQLVDLQAKITAGQDEIQRVEAQILALTNATDVYDAQQQLEVLNAQVDTWQQTYGSLVAQAEPSSANVVEVVNQAVPAINPLPSDARLYYGLAIALGAGLGTLLGLGIGVMDRAIRRPEELTPVAGQVPVTPIPRYRVGRDRRPISLASPDGNGTAAYREVRNLMRARGVASTLHSIAVTSTRVGEGKTTTIANLAVTFANSGLYVIVVDANLRNPEIEELFDTPSQPGFSELLTGETTLYDALRPTKSANLWILGAGHIPERYSDILASGQVRSVVEKLAKDADIVLFDTPAIGEEQETLLLAKHLDGVLLVAEAGRATPEELEQSIRAVEQLGVPLVSIALNKTRQSLFEAFTRRWSKDERLRRAAARRRARHIRLAASQNNPDPGRDVASPGTAD